MPKARGANVGSNGTEVAADASATPAHAGEPNGSAAVVMTPEAAVRRHLDWLEYALGAARAEESWRVARLEKASRANREKRTERLAEVREEVEELTALLAGIRDLESRARPRVARAARPARTAGAKPRRTRSTPKPAAG